MSKVLHDLLGLRQNLLFFFGESTVLKLGLIDICQISQNHFLNLLVSLLRDNKQNSFITTLLLPFTTLRIISNRISQITSIGHSISGFTSTTCATSDCQRTTLRAIDNLVVNLTLDRKTNATILTETFNQFIDISRYVPFLDFFGSCIIRFQN